MTYLYQIYTIRCRNVLSLTVYVAMIVFIKLRKEMGNVSWRQQPDHRAGEGHHGSSTQRENQRQTSTGP